MAQYKTGTVSVTNGSSVVAGSGTVWLANVSVGDGFLLASEGISYDVASVDSDTQISLTAPFQGQTAADQAYTIQRDFTSPDSIPEMSQGDIETAAIYTRAMRKVQSRLTAVGQALADHESAADPHPQYTTDLEATAIAEGEVADHVAQPNPHPQYITESEAAAAAPVQSVDGQTGVVDLSGSYEQKRQNNLVATTDPGVNDDNTAGYEPLSRWVNTTTDEFWVCISAATGAANWQQATLTLDELGSAALADTSDFAPEGVVPSGFIGMWSGSTANIPTGWALCDGANGTPDLRERFVFGAGDSYSVGDTGGSADAVVVSHSHTASTDTAGSHTHTGSTNTTGSHSHTYDRFESAGTNAVQDGGVLWRGVSRSTSSAGSHSHSLSINANGNHSHDVTVDNTGGSGTDKNLPPYYVLAYIMKL